MVPDLAHVGFTPATPLPNQGFPARFLESVAREVNKSYSTYFKHPDVGWPRTASPYKTRTLEISEPASEHVKVKPDGHATIRVTCSCCSSWLWPSLVCS